MSKIPCERCESRDRANCNCGWTRDDLLTFSSAMALDPSEVEYGFGGDWFNLGSAGGGPWTLNQLRAVKFRRARSRRSRVQEMAEAAWPDVDPARSTYASGAHAAIRAVCEWLKTETPCILSAEGAAKAIEREFLEPR